MFARISGRKIAWALAVAISFGFPHLARCAGEDNLLQEMRTADQELNSVYNAMLRTVSKSAREQLRVAERAWLAFITKNDEAVAEVARTRPAASTVVLQSHLNEIRSRCNELRALFGRQPAVLLSSAQADAELNRVYQQCIGTLSVGAERRLREAQRAWLDFRDKHAAVNSSGLTGARAFPLLTVHRLTSLREIYSPGAVEPRPQSTPSAVAEDKQRNVPDPSIPDPFATAR